MGPVISVYTPSNTDPGTLKRIFVQRHRLLEKLVERLARSMTSADKHHALLVGPRGSGKTHLVTLVEHELRGRPGLSGVMRIAWLGEDATIATLVDLAFSVAEQLARAYPDEFPADFRDPVRGLSPDDAAEATLAAVLERLGERSLVLFMENLERAFAGLGDPGRKRWRAFLQETRKIATLATSQRLFEAVSSREEAFFGFFDIHHLQALSVAEAHELMVRISAEQGKVELTEFLGTSAGRYRVRALHHLAGGNHRLYVMLSEFLTKDSLDDLVEPFDLLAEELTPYFQSRILALAPQQARVVECLCAASGAMTVKEVAEDTFIAERSCSKQLGELKGKGYVRSHRRGRESFYEVTEPLMRLCLEVKQQRGRPLRLVAQFLRAWFSAEALGELCDDTSLSPRGAAYRTQALRLHKGFDDFIAADLRREIDASLAALDFTGTAALADELRHIDPTAADHVGARLRAASGDRDKGAPRNPDAETLLAEGIECRDRDDHERAVELYTWVAERNEATAEQHAAALFYRAYSRQRLGDPTGALADYVAVVQSEGVPGELRAWALYRRAICHVQRSELPRALSDLERVIDQRGAPVGARARALAWRGTLHWQAGRDAEAQRDYEAVLALPDNSSRGRTFALFNLPEPMVVTSSRAAMLDALRAAFRDGDRESDAYGGTPHALLTSVLRRGHSEWRQYVADLVPIYVQNGAASLLGDGVTRTLAELDASGYSDEHLDAWNEAWQAAGAGIEALDLPLSVLDAAVAAIQTKSDRPLLRLPVEVRELVRPLLSRSLG